MQSIDTSILEWIHGFSTPALDSFFLFFTDLGGVTTVTLVTFFVAAFLIQRKQYWASARVLASVGGAVAVSTLLKLLIGRSRPDLWHQLVSETSHSFPSNHATASLALTLSIVLLLWQTKYRALSLVLGAFYVFGIALSRLYLGVHFPSDIVGGWVVATAAVTSVWYLSRFLQTRRA